MTDDQFVADLLNVASDVAAAAQDGSSSQISWPQHRAQLLDAAAQTIRAARTVLDLLDSVVDDLRRLPTDEEPSAPGPGDGAVTGDYIPLLYEVGNDENPGDADSSAEHLRTPQ